MSQKKVDKYKNNKFGRSSVQKKERDGSVDSDRGTVCRLDRLFRLCEDPGERGQCESRYSNGYISTDRLYFRIIFRQRRVKACLMTVTKIK